MNLRCLTTCLSVCVAAGSTGLHPDDPSSQTS